MIKRPTIIISSSGLSASSSFAGKMAVVNQTNSPSKNYKANEHINEAVSKVLEGYDWTTVQQTFK